MVGRIKVHVLPALGWWLMVVGAVRLGFAWSGFFDARALRAGTYSNTHVTDVHGRTAGVWTLMSCTLCFLCAFNLENRPLYVATLLSFAYAYGHFVVEYLLYHTMAVASLGALGFFAVTSIVWMLVQWNVHGPRAAKCQAALNLFQAELVKLNKMEH